MLTGWILSKCQPVEQKTPLNTTWTELKLEEHNVQKQTIKKNMAIASQLAQYSAIRLSLLGLNKLQKKIDTEQHAVVVATEKCIIQQANMEEK